jgi:hypothetical protein
MANTNTNATQADYNELSMSIEDLDMVTEETQAAELKVDVSDIEAFHAECNRLLADWENPDSIAQHTELVNRRLAWTVSRLKHPQVDVSDVEAYSAEYSRLASVGLYDGCQALCDRRMSWMKSRFPFLMSMGRAIGDDPQDERDEDDQEDDDDLADNQAAYELI